MNVIVNDLLVNYQIQGDGRPILLLHGWGDTLATFDSLSRLLVKEFQVIRLDLPGFGTTQSPSESWGLGDYALFLKNFIDKLKLEPYAIVGHSNGGAIAVVAIANRLLIPERLVLIASAGIRQKSTFKKTAWKAVARAGKLTTTALPQRVKQRLRTRLYRAAGSDILVAPHMEATFTRIVGQDIQADTAKLKLTTLILSGDDDTSTPLSDAETFQRIVSTSRLVVVAGGDHFIHQNRVNEVARDIREFLL